MDAFLIGIAAAFNLLVILKKLEAKRYQDASFDAAFLFLLSVMFGGTLGGMIVATIASAFTSMYLYINPPSFLPNIDLNKFKDKLPK